MLEKSTTTKATESLDFEQLIGDQLAELQAPAVPVQAIYNVICEPAETVIYNWIKTNAPAHIWDLYQSLDWANNYAAEAQQNGGKVPGRVNIGAEFEFCKALKALEDCGCEF